MKAGIGVFRCCQRRSGDFFLRAANISNRLERENSITRFGYSEKPHHFYAKFGRMWIAIHTHTHTCTYTCTYTYYMQLLHLHFLLFVIWKTLFSPRVLNFKARLNRNRCENDNPDEAFTQKWNQGFHAAPHTHTHACIIFISMDFGAEVYFFALAYV